MAMFGKMTVVGVGLIGGSAGLAALKRGVAREVWGVARRDETLKAALEKGAVSRGTLDLAEGVKDADFILVAVPVCSVPDAVRRSLEHARPGALFTDAGSTKREVVSRVAAFMPGEMTFVGSHPVAGSEKAGVEYADGDLFLSSTCVVTPLEGQTAGVAEVSAFWEALGMDVALMSPAEHDRILAFTSHLPHAAACALVNLIPAVTAGEHGGLPSLMGGGFRDTTRIASSSPLLWRDIFLTNRDELARVLGEYIGLLEKFAGLLKDEDGDALFGLLEKAADLRLNLAGKPASAPARRKVIVAIDGPAGSGKSTVSRLVAGRLGYVYLDTGAMYRAVTWKAMREKADLGDKEAVAEIARRLNIEFEGDRVIVDGKDVTGLIREPEVTRNVYLAADVSRVRAAMVDRQRRLGGQGGIVAEGRDIGTIVFPRAEKKFYLDASIRERARRRYAELKEKGADVKIETVEKEIAERDEKDAGRKIAPLRVAEGAVVIDTTDMSIEEVVEAIVKMIDE